MQHDAIRHVDRNAETRITSFITRLAKSPCAVIPRYDRNQPTLEKYAHTRATFGTSARASRENRRHQDRARMRERNFSGVWAEGGLPIDAGVSVADVRAVQQSLRL